MNTALVTALKAIVGDNQVFTDQRSLEVFSKDHSWFSPVLVETLKNKLAEVVVAPGSSDELQRIIALAVEHGLPLTVRGAGTGNYGQAVPLSGGILANLHRLNRILEIDAVAGTARVEAGVRMGALERKAREVGWELRIYPSTWATCTIGGFVGGGFGGVGSINHGTLWDGNVLAAQVIPMTANPQKLELTGPGCAAVIHAYGTTAIMTELTIPLAKAVDWAEAVISFPTLERAIGYALKLASDSSITKRELSINEAGIPEYFTPLKNEGAIMPDRANVLLEVDGAKLEVAVQMALEYGGSLDWHNPPETYHKGGIAISDFTWNHTTLWALKTDPNLTYLQSRFEVGKLLEQVALLKSKFGDEILLHLELIRENLADGGPLVAASLPIVRYTTKERLYEMIHYCEEIGIQIADPHVYYLDEDSRWNGEAVIKAVARFNPLGLLNPGKIKQLETGEIGVQSGSWFGGKTATTL